MEVSNQKTSVLNHLSLFSGYEGFGLGLRLAGIPIRTVGYVEIEPYCQELLRARIRDGILDWAPIIANIRAADFRPMAGLVDIITAGFPCQPHSFAGKRRGAADERNLWPETLGVIREVGPGWVLLENVPGILANGYAGTVVGELSEIGYDCLWHCVPAAAVGAPHLRWRWWCLAYPLSPGLEGWAEQQLLGQQPPAERSSVCRPYAGGLSTERATQQATGITGTDLQRGQWWATEPGVGRVANGVASRVDRLKAIGNGIVPAVAARFLNNGSL